MTALNLSLFKLVKKQFQVIVFEFLGFLVPGHRIPDIAEICISRYRTRFAAKLRKFFYRRAFVSGRNVKFQQGGFSAHQEDHIHKKRCFHQQERI